MRGLETSVVKIRHEVFKEVAKVAFDAEPDKVNDAIEGIPYTIVPTEQPRYRESVYRERAVVSERVRLAMGMSLRPQDKPVHITAGVDQSDISDRYYDPPLMQVIPSACDKCPENVYEVSNQCRSCVAKACVAVCPKNAISVVNGETVIDQEKCIRCGKCKKVCPYDAIAHKERPCSKVCGVKAISTDEFGRAQIQTDKCVGCGQCMVSCPFGAIADKSQIFQLIRAIKKGDHVVAEVAPAIMGQFGEGITPAIIKGALLDIGFKEVHEVASGADVAAAIGCSEHEAGLALDVCVKYFGGESFLKTRAGRLVGEICADYGYVIRYPLGKEDVTGIAYEPWHLRYVGALHAKLMAESGLTLEEYYAVLQPNVWYASGDYLISKQTNSSLLLPTAWSTCEISPDNMGGYLVTVKK